MSNIQKQHGVSGKGNGKWNSLKSLAKYRVKRNKKNNIASESRKRNRK